MARYSKPKLTKKQLYERFQVMQYKLSKFDELSFSQIIQLKYDIELCMANDKEFNEFPQAKQVVECIDEILTQYRASFQFVTGIEKALNKIVTVFEAIVDEHTESEVHMCIRCGKRQRKFDDYCGRCADELGIRPKGKIV
jgi:hypothetical protein